MHSSNNTIMCTILRITVLLLLLIPSSDGHGQMCEPRQRGAYNTASGRCQYDKTIGATNIVVDYCPHCLSGGGVSEVSQNLPPSGWSIYDPINDIKTAQRAGLCGDSRKGTDHLLGGNFVPPRYMDVPIVNVSQTGGTIDFVMQIDTNHNGYFEFFLCDLDACGTSDIHVSCFSGGHCYKLQRFANSICEDLANNTKHFCAPIDEDYPGRWYIPCRRSQIVFGGENGTMRYTLPDGITCKHCVVQWYWATANSCNSDGFKEYFEKQASDIKSLCNVLDGGSIAYTARLDECAGMKVPEEFWSCGDMQISLDGTSLGTVPIGPTSTPTPISHPSKTFSPVNMTLTPPISVSPSQSGQRDRRTPAPSPTATVSSEGPVLTSTPNVSPDVSTSGATNEGFCIADNGQCNGTVPCCTISYVCAHTIRGDGFNCNVWWSLWQEVSDQRNLRG